MAQNILTYIIVGLAVAYVVYNIVRIFTQKSDDGCSGSCSCNSKKQLSKK